MRYLDSRMRYLDSAPKALRAEFGKDLKRAAFHPCLGASKFAASLSFLSPKPKRNKQVFQTMALT